MPLQAQTPYSKRFHEQLNRIRANIGTLPEDKRPHFQSLADQAEQFHRSMEGDYAQVQHILGDMRLNEASVKFDLWAGSENIKRSLATDSLR
jgi:hypothetical protein